MPEQNLTNFPSSTNGPFQKGNWPIWLGVILVLLLVSAGTYYVGFMVNKNNRAQVQSSPTPSEQSRESVPPVESIKPIVDPGVTWLVKPEKLNDLALFDPQGYMPEYVSYSKIANLVNSGQLIRAQVQEMGIVNYLFKKDSAGTYYVIAKNSNFSSDNEQYLNKDKTSQNLLKVDYSTVYDALNPPEILTFQNKTLKMSFAGYDAGQFFDIILQNSEKSKTEITGFRETIEKVGATAYGDVYKDVSWSANEDAYNNPKIRRINYILRLADTSIARYTTKKDFLADDGTLVATFNENGQSFKLKKFNVGLSHGGCGGPAEVLYADSNLSSRLTQIGATSANEPLYTLTNTDDDILKNAYETYKSGRTEDSGLLSYEAYASKKPILVWQDPFGNYLLFADKSYDTLAECGKPVIYLYPEKTISVSVKVGANVKISEPTYNSGWKVTANPNGSIINQDGETYDSLYWEGTGDGSYPPISQGRVVSSENIQTELQNDLNALGLNKKESGDFIAFWLPKMPKTPYTRLTWLTTKEMNALAPLRVSPKPDTLARVFLDFQGQNGPESNLKPQQLTGFAREGFTLVEWGGLLVGGR